MAGQAVIPAKLHLRNFMCYRDDVPTLALDGVHLACLCGENGSGKSALLDAITWALWGETSRGKNDDDLIHLGREEMEVELEFLAGTDRYRVLRKRDRGGGRRSGRPVLELQFLAGESFVPISGNSTRETQQKIIDLLRMDYETFVNSAFLVQGRSDEFTRKAPEKRKAVLAEILNLRYYDALEQQARDEAKKSRDAARDLEVSILEMERDLQHRDEYRSKAHELELAIAGSREQRTVTQAEFDRLRSIHQDLEGQQVQLREAQQRIAQMETRIAHLTLRKRALEKEVDGLRSATRDEPAITTAYVQLQGIMSRKDALDGKAAQYSGLVERRGKMEQAITHARLLIESRLREADSKLKDLETKAAEKDRIEAQLTAAEEQVRALKTAEAHVNTRRSAIAALGEQIAEINAANQALMVDMDRIGARIADLRGGNGVCPLCGTSLSQDQCEGVLEDYERRGKDEEDLHRANQASISRMKAEQEAARKELLKGEASLKTQQNAVHSTIGARRAALQIALQAKEEVPAVAATVVELDRRLAKRDYALDDQRGIEELRLEIENLAYDDQAHRSVRREFDALRPSEARYRSLEEAKRRLPNEEKHLDETVKDLASRQDESSVVLKQASGLSQALATLPQVVREQAGAEAALRTAEQQIERQQQELGAAQGVLLHLETIAPVLTEKRKRRNLAADDQSAYEELVLAFGRKGVQALIIDAARPEIEEEANLLLGRMTDNRMSLKLETQAPYRTREGTQETLEIKVADELGTRPYETFSGGEAYRINMALRIALSRLLARRAGAPLPTLFIDEGFGTQDASGRDKLVETINAIQDEFERILVITHIDELKEQFPVRIEVTKTPEGSTFVLI